MGKVEVITSIEDKAWLVNMLNSSCKLSTYISTDMTAKRDFVQTLRFKRVKCVPARSDSRSSILVKHTCSLHVAGAESQSLVQTMANFLNFVYHTTFAKQNEAEIEKFMGR